MITAIASAFGGVSGGGGESGAIYNGVNSGLTGYGLGGNPGDTQPAAYLNYILFDQTYKVQTMGWQRVPASSFFSKQQMLISNIAVKEAGYLFNSPQSLLRGKCERRDSAATRSSTACMTTHVGASGIWRQARWTMFTVLQSFMLQVSKIAARLRAMRN